ncbi:uncharacterized protein LOC119667200 [Teleopsis dalmanni]|uniref:uncharacterized protein LOC119667200 n=1 Tax=Teleopsis dalmanni TaxID=139649 RepID=UPI0018CFDC11|nr:uncharacterized protein LOC119667200 [Teleopsis dalmanni]
MSSNGDDEHSNNYTLIYELIDKLALSMSGGNKIKPGREIVKNMSNYISNSPITFNKLLPYDSIALEAKVRQHICKVSSLDSVMPHGLTTSFITNNLDIKLSSINHGGIGFVSNVSLFQKINEKLKNSKLHEHGKNLPQSSAICSEELGSWAQLVRNATGEERRARSQEQSSET